MPAWITLLFDDVIASARVELAGVTVARATGEQRGTRSRVKSALAGADKLVFVRRARSFEAVEVRAWAASRGVAVTGIPEGSPHEAETAGSAARKLDVLLDLRDERHRPALAWRGETVRWWLSGVPMEVGDLHAAHPRIVYAALHGRRVIPFELRARVAGGREDVVLDHAVCPTHPSSPLMTGEYLAASARQLVARTLDNSTAEAVASACAADVRVSSDGLCGPDASEPAAPPSYAPAATRLRSCVATGHFFVRAAAHQALKFVQEEQWHLLVGEQSAERLFPDPASLLLLAPPAGCYWADPFIITHQGSTHVFFEEFVYATRRGRIAVTTLDSRGRPCAPRTALERDWHLSYPCTFSHGGRLFMVPEAAETGSLDLYECVGAPDQWERRRTLVEGVPLVDATVFAWDDRWWMFASLQKPPGLRTAELLLLYMTDDPVDGTWSEHPESPLAADVTSSRPAGAPIVLGDRLYRLAQDGSRGYGWAITVSEVVALTPSTYADRHVTQLRPEWARGLCGTHTMNREGRYVVMDVCRSVRRVPGRRRAESMLD